MPSITLISHALGATAQTIVHTTDQVNHATQAVATALLASPLERHLDGKGLGSVSTLLNNLASMGTSTASTLASTAHAVLDPLAGLANSLATSTAPGTLMGSVLDTVA